MSVIAKILNVFGFSTNVVSVEPETIDQITVGFQTQIDKMQARVEFDEKAIEEKNKEQLRLEAEKQILEGNVSRGKRMIGKFSDLIA